MKRFFSCFVTILILVSHSCTTSSNTVEVKDKPGIEVPALSLDERIKPSHISNDEMLNNVEVYYNYYRDKYIKPSVNNTIPGGFYLEADSSSYVPPHWKSGGQVPKSNSEATGYGMIISALMGNKEHFDGFFKFAKSFYSTNNRAFMSWIIPKSENVQYRDGAATDGDLDIAYALLIAHDNWGSDGDINYYQEAKKIIKAAEKSLIGGNKVILFGDWCKGSTNKNYSHGTRSSDWLVGHFEVFEKVTGNGIWSEVTDKIYDTIIPNVMNDKTGLVPDFTTGNLTVPTGTILEDDNDKDFDWNACRYPWRQSTAYHHITDDVTRQEIRNNLWRVSEFAKAKIGSSYSFDNIKTSISLDGEKSSNFSSSAYISPMILSFTLDDNYQAELDKGWDYMISNKSNYYGDSINLLSMLVISGIWEQPLK